MRTSRHETQAACSSKTATTSVNDVELDTPLSVDNKLPAGEDLTKLNIPDQEYSSPVRRSTKAGGNRPSNHLPANDMTTSKPHPSSVEEGSPFPDSLPVTVASSPPRVTHEHERSIVQNIPIVVKPVPDIVFDEEADLPTIERHKQDARRDANAAPTPPDNNQHSY